MIRIVGVHGVRNFDAVRDLDGAAAHLAERWTEALTGQRPGDRIDRGDVDMRVVYYADRTARGVAQSADPFQALEQLDPAANEMVLAWARDHGVEVGGRQGAALAPLRQIVSAVASRRDVPERWVAAVVAGFFPEVAAYFDPAREGFRAEIQERVAAAVARHEPHVVVAHSLGSVVAYEACHTHRVEADMLLTLGSPLALPRVVHPRLRTPAQGAHGCPPGVRRWVNIADPGDPVAIPPRGVGQLFRGVDLDLETAIHWRSVHAVERYLALPVVAGTLVPYLRRRAGE